MPLNKEEIKDTVLTVLEKYPHHDIQKLFSLLNIPLTNDLARGLMNSDPTLIQIQNFQEIDDKFNFLFNCGKALLEYGKEYAKNDFLNLAIGLFQKAYTSHNDSAFLTEEARIKECICKTVLAELGFDVISNTEYSLQVYEELKEKIPVNTEIYPHILVSECKTRLVLVKFRIQEKYNLNEVLSLCKLIREIDKPSHQCFVNNLIYEGICRYNLADLGIKPNTNIKQSLELLETSKKYSDDRFIDAKILFHEGVARSIASSLGINSLENLDKSLNLLKDANRIYRKGSFYYARTLMNEGISRQMLAENGFKSIDNLEKSIKLYEKCRIEGFQDTNLYSASSMMNEGLARVLFSELGINSEENLIKAVDLLEKSRDDGLLPGSRSFIGSMMNEGIVLKNLSDMKVDPVTNLIKSIKIFEETQNQLNNNKALDYAKSLMNKAVCLNRLSEHISKALKEINYSLEELNDNADLNQEEIVEILKHLSQNVQILKDAEIGDNELNDFFSESKIVLDDEKSNSKKDLNNFIVIYERYSQKLNSYPKNILNKIISLYEQIRLIDDLGLSFKAKCLLNEGNVARNIAKLDIEPKINFKKAENLFLEALDISKSTENNLLNIKVNSNLGILKYNVFEFKQAYTYFKNAIEIIEDIRNSISLADSKEEYFETVVDIYKNMVFTCLKIKKDDEAFYYAESAKGRTFLELLSREYEDQCFNDSIENKFEFIGLKPDKKLRSLDLDDELLGKLMEKLESENPELFEVKMAKPITLDDLKERLEEKTLIEYFVGEELAIFVIKDDIVVKKVKISEEELSDKVQKFRYIIRNMERTLEDGENPHKTSLDQEAEKILREFYQILIKPIVNLLTPEIIIVPHGHLHILPFHALLDERYLLEDYKISFSQNASAIKYSKIRNSHGVIVIGNPNKGTELDLPMAEEEALAIGKYFNTKPIIGVEAQKNRILNDIKDKMIIHFACHSLFNEIDASKSGILMSDKFITPKNFLDNSINAQLTVISACESGLIELSKSDIVEGLVRSIQLAGCRFVIASLWKVEDESTKELFLDFYQHPNPDESGGLISSIRDAELRMMKSKGFYFWAPFQIYGI